MTKLIDKIEEVASEARESLARVDNDSSLEEWRVMYLGRKGLVPQLLRGVKNLSETEKKEAGQLGNRVRREIEQAYRDKAEKLGESEKRSQEEKEREGGTQEGESVGHFHPLSVSMLRIHKIFTELGFLLAEGPLAEDTKYAFDFLNIPLEHPARGLMDTFYLEGGQALRPHTSPVQLRSVLENDLTPPFKVYSQGRVFRAERTDASHQHTFYQVEGLMVGEDVSVADFKGVIEHFFSSYFKQETNVRLRPSYFPFVEPGFEVDMKCIFCGQKGCSTCKRTGWIEMMGAGMVHPNVLRNMNIDADKFQGFAFGGGMDRLAMLLHGVDDVRHFLSNDIRFLRQFY